MGLPVGLGDFRVGQSVGRDFVDRISSLNSLTKKLLIKPHMYSVTGVRPVPAELHLMQVYMPYFVFRNPKDPFVRNIPTETYIGFSLLRIQGTGY